MKQKRRKELVFDKCKMVISAVSYTPKDEEDTTTDATCTNSNAPPMSQVGAGIDLASPPPVIYLMAALSAMGGFLFGYDTGIVSGAMVFVRKTFHLNYIWQELVVSITLLGAWVLSLVAGSLSDAYGRQRIILVASVVFATGSIIMGLAWSKWPLLVGRLTVGMAIGLASTVVPMYIAEVAPVNIRGSLVTLNQSFICLGQLTAALAAGAFSYDHENGWRWMLALAAVPALLQFLGFVFMPESPRWLIKQGRLDEAMRALERIRMSSNNNVDNHGQQQQQQQQLVNVRREFELIKENSREVEAQQMERQQFKRNILMSVLRNKATRRALIIGCLLQSIQQLSGINTIMYYNATIIEMSGVTSASLAVWLTVPTAAVLTIFSMLAYVLVERIGRRPLILASLFGVVVALVILATGFYLTSLDAQRQAAVNHTNISSHQMNDHHDQLDPLNKEACSSHLSTCRECLADIRCAFCPTNSSAGGCFLKNLFKQLNASVGSFPQTDRQDNFADCPRTAMSGNSGSATIYDIAMCVPQNDDDDDHPIQNNREAGISLNTWLVLTGLILYLAAFAPGMAPMPWTINSEIYPMWARGVCYSIATSFNWLFNMFVSLTFLSLTQLLTTYGTFYMYSIIASIGWLIIFWKLPETKGRSLEEVSSLFDR